MNFETYVANARERGASDLHIEAGQPIMVRVRGELQGGGGVVSAEETRAISQELLGPENWQRFLERRSFDFSRRISGVRCRINVLCSSHGIGLAVRLLARSIPTIESLNLHPCLRELVAHEHGLVLVSGATGSGKSSTLAALIQEINLTARRHVITVEDPIEYALTSQRAFIRQREVGAHTPSFEQALIDALREDPDVLMVGEMRHPEVMRLTLNVAETGHLVFATVHSANTMEALQRVVAAFSPEIQATICAQLADTLVAVVAQRLRYRSDLRIRVPECEILTGSPAVRNHIRKGDFYKIESALTTGAKEGMFTFERYLGWMESRSRWFIPGDADHERSESEPVIPEPLPAPGRSRSAGSLPTAAAADEEIINLEPTAESISEFVSRLKPAERAD